MRDDYKLKGPTARVQVEVEQTVADKLQLMEKFTKFSQSELVNTALKRFIAQHKDFLPSADEEAKYRA
jgi:hypothetical protein